MKRHKRRARDAEVVDPHAAELHDWQQHQYLPGHYSGRIHPLLSGTRPNPWGWVMLVAGALGVAGVLIVTLAVGGELAGADADTILERAIGGFFILSVSVLTAASGWRLLRGRRSRR